MSPVGRRSCALLAVFVAAVLAGCGSDGGGAAETLTYFDHAVPAAFAKCGEPSCTEQVGKAKWTLKHIKLAGDTAYKFPALNAFTWRGVEPGPMIFLAGTAANVHPTKARDVSIVAADTIVDVYESKDVPCVSHGTCTTTAALVAGKLMTATYSICYENKITDLGGAHNVQSINPEVIAKVRDRQDERLPLLTTARTVKLVEPGPGSDIAAQTHVRYDQKQLVGVNASVTYNHPQFDAASFYGCVNTFVVVRSPMTELLFKKFEAARKADEELTVPR